MDKYSETKEIINNMASVKMAMNSHKGSIEVMEPDVVMQLMVDEVHELQRAVDNPVSLINIIEEAADVQNFLIALVHRAVNQYRTRK